MSFFGIPKPGLKEMCDEGTCPINWLPDQFDESKNEWENYCSENEGKHLHIIIHNLSSFTFTHAGDYYDKGHQGPMAIPERFEPNTKIIWGVTEGGWGGITGGTTFHVEGTGHNFTLGYMTRWNGKNEVGATESANPKDGCDCTGEEGNVFKIGDGKIKIDTWVDGWENVNMRCTIRDGDAD